jgi:Family of unknown function (DUF6600)
MKSITFVLLAVSIALFSGVLAPPANADVSFEFAYSNLSGHGSWLVSAEYGRVWQPAEYNHDWNPYDDGHWVDTDLGWTWVSDYDWGSIPYHYGTWVLDPRLGWVWIPGDVWAPSWVIFRTSPDYIGWAPVPPGFSVGVSIDVDAPASFTFVRCHDFLAPRIRTARVPMARASALIRQTTAVNNIAVQNNVVINRGPDVRLIEKATGRPVRPQPIERVARVAPFERVGRERLAVAPEKVKRGVRVAVPVPASRALPIADKQDRSERQVLRHAPDATVARGNLPKPHEASPPANRGKPPRVEHNAPAAAPTNAKPKSTPKPRKEKQKRKPPEGEKS